MFIKAKKIIGSKVVTQSGQPLGRVVDFEIDTSNQSIAKYYAQGDLFSFLREPLVISANQVVKVKKDKIIVEDTVVSEKIIKKKTTADVEYAK